MSLLTSLGTRSHGISQNVLRAALSQYVTNGLSVALGLGLIVLGLFVTAGLAAATSASVGVLITSLPDVPSPRRRKIMQVLPAPLLGTPLYILMQLSRHDSVLLGVVLVTGTFLSVMLMAWGKRGGPICFALLFSMLFSLASPPMESPQQVLSHAAWFATGAGLYLVWAVLTAHWLNRRFRAQLLAEVIYRFSRILLTLAQRFDPESDHQALLEAMFDQQASFADQLQDARNVVLESPTTPLRQRYAGMLLSLLEARDHQLACNLDLDVLLEHQASTPHLPGLQQALRHTAGQLQVLSMALLLGRRQRAIAPIADVRGQLVGALPPPPPANARLAPLPLRSDAPDAATLLHSMANRIGHINDEAVKMSALARGDLAPELSLVRNQWQLFVSATTWSIKPLLGQLGWRAPTLRYALRATLAVATGYVVALHLPWATHEHWVLIAIVVVMRGNLAQTVQRRNARVAGTVLGCLLVMALLLTHPGAKVLFAVVALATGLAHAFALRRYLYTTIAGTVSGLLQAHLLLVGLRPTFAIGERLADTLLGALLAWLFSYVLPSWERNQIPGLVKRSIKAQSQHAKLALALLSTEQTADLNWRLARREAFDSLSALTLATQRSLAEPRHVRPPLEPLEVLQARSYQLLAQLTAVKSLLLLRRQQLDLAQATPALTYAAQCIVAELSGAPMAQSADRPPDVSSAGQPYVERPDPLLANDLTPWLLRRLQLACVMARELRLAASRVRV